MKSFNLKIVFIAFLAGIIWSSQAVADLSAESRWLDGKTAILFAINDAFDEDFLIESLNATVEAERLILEEPNSQTTRLFIVLHADSDAVRPGDTFNLFPDAPEPIHKFIDIHLPIGDSCRLESASQESGAEIYLILSSAASVPNDDTEKCFALMLSSIFSGVSVRLTTLNSDEIVQEVIRRIGGSREN